MISNLFLWSCLSLFISDFLIESQKKKKTNNKDHSFCSTFWLKKHHAFYETQVTLNSTKNTPATQPETLLTLQIFQQTCCWLGSDKIFSLRHSQTSKNCILKALGKRISIYSCKSQLEKLCFRDVGNFGGWELTTFLKATCCSYLIKCFTFFYFN